MGDVDLFADAILAEKENKDRYYKMVAEVVMIFLNRIDELVETGTDKETAFAHYQTQWDQICVRIKEPLLPALLENHAARRDVL